jgi:integrase
VVYIGPREARELAQQNKPQFFPRHEEWRKCMERFLIRIKSKCDSQGSLRVYECYLRLFFSDPEKTPNDYTQSDVLDFIASPNQGTHHPGAPVKPGTRNGRLIKIRSFYTFAARYRIPAPTKNQPNRMALILEVPDPTQDIGLAVDQAPHKTMNDEEMERFFAAIDTRSVQGLRDRCLFLFYFWLGRRKSSVLALRWGDLEQTRFMDDETGRMQQGWIYHYREKGGKVGFAELPPPLPQLLDAYLVASGRKDFLTKESPLFVGTKNCEPDSPLDGRTADHLFRKYARIAGIDKRHSIHSFRHTAAARRWEEELASGHPDLLRLMRWMGHENPQTTLKYLEGLVYVSDSIAKRMYKRYGDL